MDVTREQVKDFLKHMSLMDAATLVKELESELGVSAAAPVAVAAGALAATETFESPSELRACVAAVGEWLLLLEVVRRPGTHEPYLTLIADGVNPIAVFTPTAPDERRRR